jgi:magnesium transporter
MSVIGAPLSPGVHQGDQVVLRKFALGDPAAGALWIDLLDPTEAERAQAESAGGLAVPTIAHLSEIESSSRLRQRDGVLTMSMPMVAIPGASRPGPMPIGFVLSQLTLVTIRFSPLAAFDDVAGLFDNAGETAPTCSLDVFVDLCDEMVDRMADALEGLAAALNDLSAAVFSAEDARGRRSERANSRLRDQLKQVGQMGDRASGVRDALLGLGRILAYVDGPAKTWDEARFAARLHSLREDVTSLNDYEAHLSDKVQFLLDALVGMIGIAQNDIFKILTIVSIVGIPPTLVASIYGMNFKIMPELGWTLGYPYGLAMIVLSAIIPVAWFKYRGWF